MAKLTLGDLSTTLSNTAATTINNNNSLIEAALENTLSRDGTTPNQMNSDLDMNNNDILNVGHLDVESIIINGVPGQVVEFADALKISNNLSDILDDDLARSNIGAASELYTKDVLDATESSLTDFINASPVTLEEMGWSGTGNIRTALSKALKTGREVRLPAGTFNVVGDLDLITNIPVALSGAGFGMTKLVFSGHTRGIRIEQDTYLNPTMISDLGILTNGLETGEALYIKYSAADSINNRNISRCVVRDVMIRGDDIFSDGWNKGIVLHNVHRPSIIRPQVTGRRNLPAGGVDQFLNMETGIEIIGDYPPTFTAIPSDTLIENPRLDQMINGVKAIGEAEGVLINTPVFVALNVGVAATFSTTRPWVKVDGGHMNIFSFGATCLNAPQSTFSNLLIYKFQDTIDDTYGISLDTCDDSSISNVTFYNLAADAVTNGEWNAIAIANSAGVRIKDWSHINPSKSVILSGTTTLTDTDIPTLRGTFTGATVQVYDDTSSGVNKFNGNNKPVSSTSNAGVVNLVADTPASCTETVTLNVNKGERYLVTGFIQATKTGAAGDFLTTLSTTGTSTRHFGNNRSSILHRATQGASATVAHAPGGILTIDATGTLVIQVVGTSVTSGSTVQIADAQLSVTQL